MDEIKEEVKEEKKTAKKKSTSKVKKLVRKVGDTVSVYRTDAEMKEEGGEWEKLEDK